MHTSSTRIAALAAVLAVGLPALSASAQCPEDTINVLILTDAAPEQTTWELRDQSDDSLVASGGPYTGQPNILISTDVCVEATGCFAWTIFDSGGNGIPGGGYQISLNDVIVAASGSFASAEVTIPDIGHGCSTVIGACCGAGGTCMEFTEDGCAATGGAYEGDGTTCSPNPCPQPTGACCTAGVCSITTAAACVGSGGSYQGNATTCTPNLCPAACPQDTINVLILTDTAPEETTWELRDQSDDSLVASGGPYTGQPSQFVSTDVCVLATKCYAWTIFDSAGNGIAGGGYQISLNGDVVAASGSFIDEEQTVPDIGNGCTGMTGACCSTDGSCTVVTPAACTAAGGDYEGDATTCAPNPCPQPPTGACCDAGAACSIATAAACAASGGTYQGNATTCTPNPCSVTPTGACCDAGAACSIATAAACAASGGTYQGNATTCTPNPCPPPATGACCAAGGACSIATAADCAGAGGTYQGNATTCTPNPCPPPATGACCAAGGACSIATAADCAASGGTYQGNATTCTPNPCFCPGMDTLNVQILTDTAPEETTWELRDQSDDSLVASGGPYTGQPEQMISTDVCVDPTGCFDWTIFDAGADGIPGGGYQISLNGDVVASSGSFSGAELTVPDLGNGCIVGACCLTDGSCSIVTATACAVASGTYQGDGTSCAPNPCPSPTGACCLYGGLCADDVTPATCDGAEGDYQGGGSECATTSCAPLRVLFIVGSSAGLTGQEVARSDWLIAEGYAVTLLTASSTQSAYNAAVAQADVAYISEEVLSGDVGTKLTAAPIGVVNEETALYDEFGISAAGGVANRSAITILDIGHPITSVFSLGGLPITTSLQELALLGGAVAPGADVLAQALAADNILQLPTLTAVETGAAITGGTAAGRRVMLPFGGTNFNFSVLNASGRTILRRSLDWAAGALGETGACCFVDGSCAEDLDEIECDLVEAGSWSGAGSTCASANCPVPPGACCHDDGTCNEVANAAACTALGGEFEGAGTACAGTVCPVLPGACCLPTGACQLVANAVECTALAGAFQGHGTACAAANCPVLPGACCLPGGACQNVADGAACTALAGAFQGHGTACATATCPVLPGACCLPNGACQDVADAPACTALSGAFQGHGTACATATCPVLPGACCLAGGACQSAADAPACTAIGGAFQGHGTACATTTCPILPGACCLPNGTCQNVADAPACTALAGAFQGHGSACATEDCPVLPGACCLATGACQDVADAPACTAIAGAFQGHGTACATTTCPVLPGACCVDGACQMANDEPACIAIDGTFLGAGTACETVECPDPCAADFNNDGDIGFFDLGGLLVHWEVAPNGQEPWDLNGDHEVGFFDLATLLTAWGACP